jgi:plastocyanin
MNQFRLRNVVQIMNRIAVKATVAATAAVLALAGCSSSSKSATKTTTAAATSSAATTNSSTSTAPTTTSGISIKGFAYSGTLTVKAGAKVTVTNKDSVAHTLTDKATKKFDTGNIPGNGGTGTFTAPTTPGTYKFGCTYHPNMAGTLVVTPR